MTLRITVDIFSGRENPTIQLRGRDEREALRRLAPERRLSRDESLPLPTSTLGYRGMVVEQTDGASDELPSTFRVANGQLIGRDLKHHSADDSFEQWVLGRIATTTDEGLGPIPFPIPEIERFKEIRLEWPIKLPVPLPKALCTCAPIYEPGWWNVPQRQPSNNCYNYATNYRSNTFAQPGRAAGAMYTSLTCAAVLPAAVADELIDRPNAGNRCPPDGHLVALVVWPGGDFHWYRKGKDGYWSHKPGGTAVTNLDNSGNPITDPRTANRGPYTDFCTFMVVMHGHIKVG